MNLQKQFRLRPNSQGVLITDVEPKSDAEKSGFQAGDIIIQIENMEIKKFQDVEKAIKSYNDRYKRVYVDRYGQTIMLVIK
jgi:serine protease Do